MKVTTYKRGLGAIFLCLTSQFTILLAQGPVGPPSLPKIADDVLPSTVTVGVYDEGGKLVRHGSGFFVSNDGKVVTNYHVIQNAKTMWVTTFQGGSHRVMGILGVDRENDLAVLSVSGKRLSSVTLSQQDSSKVGERVVVVGTPIDVHLESTLSTGIISQLRIEKGSQRIQHTAPVSPGSSGGPIFDDRGEVIGVVVSSIPFASREVPAQNINFGIPVKYVRRLIEVAKNPIELGRTRMSIALDSIRIFLKKEITIPSGLLSSSLNDANTLERLSALYKQLKLNKDTIDLALASLSEKDLWIRRPNFRALLKRGFLHRRLNLAEWAAYWDLGFEAEMLEEFHKRDAAELTIGVIAGVPEGVLTNEMVALAKKRVNVDDLASADAMPNPNAAAFLMRVGKPDLAKEVLRRQVASSPKDWLIHRNLALAYYALGNARNAIAELQVAYINIQDKETAAPGIHFYVGLIYFLEQDAGGANTLMTYLVDNRQRLGFYSLAAILARGASYAMLGNRDKALVDYQILKNSNHPGAQWLFDLIYE